MKTAELTGALLDYWVARAEGMAAEIYLTHAEGPAVCVAENRMNFEPSTEWAHGGPLIAKYRLNISETDPPGYVAWSNDLDMEYGDTPLQAICRAVVRAAFGDEVEEVPCSES